MLKFVTRSPDETEAAGAAVAAICGATSFVALFGGLGAGKTAFVRGFAKALGFDGEVTSPTFALVHEYTGGKFDIFHFDMYRITSPEDLWSTGFFDYDGMGITITEWSENIEDSLPDDCIRVSIAYGSDENERIITAEGF
ncbi:MAG: tRNA (adenosine(37)-N6)-threonylcarbamoyltransferase complex ATPase subunit type 1 TsaE [Clostridia bacterium]|nr:tRNA (adenosine(37)-N6)-threonylcarbamoyltransferase complex ATPase subunit type 1 TsaE [Clostridia bacterium]